MDRAERRFRDKTKALRKKKISDAWMGNRPYYDNLHQYSKNKIHCSCPYCTIKTNKKWYGIGSKNWKHSDLIKILKMQEEENKLDIEEEDLYGYDLECPDVEYEHLYNN